MVGDKVAVEVRVKVAVAEPVGVGLRVSVGVLVIVGVRVTVGVSVTVAVSVGVPVFVGLLVKVGVQVWPDPSVQTVGVAVGLEGVAGVLFEQLMIQVEATQRTDKTHKILVFTTAS